MRNPVIICLPVLLAGCALPAGVPAGAPAVIPAGTRATVALLETTDLHGNVVSYDYYKLAPEPSLGLERTATLIAQARAQYPDNVLLDNGDTIQGTALSDYQAIVQPLGCGETLAIYKAFNALGYDGAGIGNHDFNYGLAFLGQVSGSRFDVDGVDAPTSKRCAGPAFPQVLANVYSVKSRKPLFAPYAIIDKHITATAPDGRQVPATLRVGIIGFTPPTILTWDKRWLEGKVTTEGVRETAQRYVPELRAQGADIVVAISHGGLDAAPYSPTMENGNWYLAQVPGIDAMLIGHSHEVFPNAASTVPQFDLPGVDKARGLVHGVPTVMAGLWGKHLGVIGLSLAWNGKAWVIDKSRTTVEARPVQAGRAIAAADPAIAPLVRAEHEATIRYVKTPVGKTDFRMSTYFADVGDVSAIQVVNQAQAAYLRDYVQANLPALAQLPVLSVSSPFKTGSAGVGDYTDVRAGSIALNNAADLYLYPNALHGVKVTGAGLQAWLEKAAGRFNTIDPQRAAPQELVNAGFPGYNFDVPASDELQYEIDITRPPGQRIRNLRFRGAAVNPSQAFLVATNNYRASGGGAFPGLDGSSTVVAAPDNNRDVLIQYIRTQGQLTRVANGASRSWRFARVATKGDVVFHSAPGKEALAREAGLANVRELRADDGGGKGFALYAVDLAR